MNIRVVVPIYVHAPTQWPVPYDRFGVKNNGDVRFRQKAVGEYTLDTKHFIGIVSPQEFQPPDPITYTHFGTVVRFVTVTISGVEERLVGSTYSRLVVAPESRSVFELAC
tara:strand:- start:483 stop:812 length:330 start_codon:yes stop_codon:yes gene_type:complete